MCVCVSVHQTWGINIWMTHIKHTVFAGMWDTVAPVSILLSARCYLPKKCPNLWTQIIPLACRHSELTPTWFDHSRRSPSPASSTLDRDNTKLFQSKSLLVCVWTRIWRFHSQNVILLLSLRLGAEWAFFGVAFIVTANEIICIWQQLIMCLKGIVWDCCVLILFILFLFCFIFTPFRVIYIQLKSSPMTKNLPSEVGLKKREHMDEDKTAK